MPKRMTKKTDGGNVYKQILIDAKLKMERERKKTGDREKSLKRWTSTLDCSAIYEEEEEDSFPKTILFFDQCVVWMQLMA